ncbi:hypothetical protein [Leptolyngbya sp. NIES-2104]|uniref:hypothetical protein n=1 Tax=Leptolyngbya sp. NIES-2104 TaxID=1552121 RepID=UPI0006EC835B|nr:hypothetical protein [Leptolyngbya sp. NIES-2104]GAP94181.1 hypothetical protein NIES2104_06920 [Leptolyngbya sp. NIES-2104]
MIYVAVTGRIVREQLSREIAQYGGAELRNVSIRSEWHSGNSDHQFEVTSIQFEYRLKPQWQTAETRLMTATNLERTNSLVNALPFRRIYCAGSAV